MTIHARKAGKWRRGLTAVGAAGALFLGGIALAPTVGADQQRVEAPFKISSVNDNSMQDKCNNKAGSDAHPFVDGTSKPDGWIAETPHSFKDGVITCNGYVMVTVPPVCEGDDVLNDDDVCVKPDPDPNPDPGSPGTESITSPPPSGMRWVDGPSCIQERDDWVPVSANIDCVLRADSGPPWALAGPVEGEQEFTPPPPCWSGEGGNNCPVGGALQIAAPSYAIVGVPVTLYAYAAWRPDADSPAAPTTGTAVIRVDGEDYSGVEFVDGVAEWRFIPKTEGLKEFTASGVVSSGISGANAYVDSVPASTYVLEYTPAAYAKALKKKRVEVGQTYVITDPNQAKSYLKGRYDWSVSKKSDDVCAVYETKKGTVKAKFTGKGKCTVIWLDKESEESGKYTFIAKK